MSLPTGNTLFWFVLFPSLVVLAGARCWPWDPVHPWHQPPLGTQGRSAKQKIIARSERRTLLLSSTFLNLWEHRRAGWTGGLRGRAGLPGLPSSVPAEPSAGQPLLLVPPALGAGPVPPPAPEEGTSGQHRRHKPRRGPSCGRNPAGLSKKRGCPPARGVCGVQSWGSIPWIQLSKARGC